jgi:hypothetical protein
MYKKSVAIIVPAAFVAAFLVSTNASARQIVTLSGTYSRGQVKKNCDASGGAYISFHDGSYSCYSQSGNGNVVDCNKRGKCTGSIPRESKPPHTISGILHPPSGVKTTGGANDRHLGHGRVVKTSGLKTKTIDRTRGGPTDSGGKGLASYRSTGTTFPNGDEHHEGRHH